MELLKTNVWRNNKGVSLVEVIASIVILSIILISVFVLFVRSAETTHTTDEIVDATYVAQTELESLYAVAKNTAFSTREAAILSAGYTNLDAGGNALGYFEKTDATTGDYIKVTITQIASSTLTRVVIEVYDEKNGTMKAQMQNTIKWKAD